MALRHKMAGRLASRELQDLLIVAAQYPASYDQERINAEADAILDRAQARADEALAKVERVMDRLPMPEMPALNPRRPW